MAGAADHLPDDGAALKAALIETRAKLVGAQALIEHLQLVIAKMQREKFGPRSERSQRLIDQLELQLEELAATAAEDETKAEAAARVEVRGFTRRPATRRNFPADLPRRRIVHPVPTACPCCGGTKLSKIGEDVTETLDVVPRQWFVTEHVREKFSCRSCETINQPPAPFHAIARGFAGPSLLAMMLVEKYANHQPLNRQSEHYAREGIELSVSTMADHVGACAATLMPLHELIKAAAPELAPKTWYGMPAYAKDGNVICFFQNAGKFKARYHTFGFNNGAKLDDGAMWPTSFALLKLTAADEAKLTALVKKAVS